MADKLNSNVELESYQPIIDSLAAEYANTSSELGTLPLMRSPPYPQIERFIARSAHITNNACE